MKKVLVLLMVAALATVSQAATVSWNMNVYGDAYAEGGATRATDYAGAGAYSATYWNDSWLDGTTTDMPDNTGTATTIDIAWGSVNTWAMQWAHPSDPLPRIDADGSYNKEVMNGYLNSGGVDTSWVTLSEIPYASYDIVVYFSSDVPGRTGTVTDGATTYYFNTLGLDATLNDPSGNAGLAQTTTTTIDDYSVAANYAVFSGLSGASQTIDVLIPDWGGIAAVQIAEVPEPATMALLGLGSLVMLRKRK